jgi:hypothetical protein
LYDIAIYHSGRSPERSTASDGDELRDAVFAVIRSPAPVQHPSTHHPWRAG